MSLAVDPANPGGDALVRSFHFSKSYLAGTYALQDLSLELRKGELTFLTGPSGAGKTTLLKLVFAAERPSEGQILVLGRNVGRLRPSGVGRLPEAGLQPACTQRTGPALSSRSFTGTDCGVEGDLDATHLSRDPVVQGASDGGEYETEYAVEDWDRQKEPNAGRVLAG